MSTLANLKDTGTLRTILVPLEPDELTRRGLYGLASFMSWMENTLPSLPRDRDIVNRPLAQVFSLFADFITGTVMDYPESIKELFPHEKGIWEFRTRDIRVFGFFEKKDVFVCAFGDTAKRCHEHNLHYIYRDQAVKIAAELGLTIAPGTIDGLLS